MKNVHPPLHSSQMWRRIRWISAAAAGLASLACSFPACVGQAAGGDQLLGIAVRIDPVHPDATSAVAFSVKPLGPLPYNSISREALSDVSMSDDMYRAELDLSSMGEDKSGRFTFMLYVNRSSLFETSVQSYEIEEDPTGVFNDTIQTVSLHIGPDRTSLVGTARVPLHSPYGSPHGLTYKAATNEPPTVQSVPMGTESSFTIALDSALDRMGATLGEPTVSVNCDQCLQLPIQVRLSKNRLIPGDHVDATFTLTPNTLKAMHASAYPASDKFDADLTLTIPLTADTGGSTGQQSIPVHIKFSPPTILIVLSVLLGAVAGAFIRMFLTGTHRDRHEFFLGLIYAGVCWGLAFLIFDNGKTMIKLMGVTFYPTQIFSAFMLCLLAGGGPPLIKLLQDSVLSPMLGGGKK